MTDDFDLTGLIRQAMDGDEAAFQAVFEATYTDLRRLASRRLDSGARGTSLDTTSLVHESYLRFAKAGRIRLEDRGHFLRYAGRVMRSVIVDTVRERKAQRRGGDVRHVTLATGVLADTVDGEAEILGVHEALEELAKLDERMVQVVEMRYFAGMTETEIGDVLGVSDRTVRRIWERSRLWLAESLGQG